MLRASILAWILLAGAPAIGHAQPEDGAASEATRDEEARRLFASGRAAFDARRYEAALEFFRSSHQLSGRVALLFNIAITLERLDRRPEAIAAFEQYLREAPDAPNRVETETHLRALRGTQTRTEPRPDVPATGRTTGPGAAPWIIAAVGGALTAGGVVLLLLALSDRSTVEDAATDTAWSELEPAYDRAPILSGTGIVLIAVGAAGAGVGIAWALGGAEESPDATIAVGLTGVSLRAEL